MLLKLIVRSQVILRGRDQGFACCLAQLACSGFAVMAILCANASRHAILESWPCPRGMICANSVNTVTGYPRETFIWNIDAQALSMDEIEFQKKMDSAREHLLGLSTTSENPVSQTKLDGMQKAAEMLKTNRLSDCYLPAIGQQNISNQANEVSMNLGGKNIIIPGRQSVSDLENKGSSDLLKDDQLIRYFQQYPFLYARAGDLSVEDVENLLNCYKKLVLKYVSLSKGMGVINESLPGQKMETLSKTETLKELDDVKVLGINSEKDEGIYRADDVSIENLLSGGDDLETKRLSSELVDNPSAEREEEVSP